MVRYRVLVACYPSLVAFCLSACAEAEATDLVPQGGGGGKGDGSCATVPARIATVGAPPYWCGQVDANSAALMAGVNRFWHSSVTVCACGADDPNGCQAAAAVSGGWVYANLTFVNNLAVETGSALPSAYVYAHEFGHEIQGAFNVLPSITQQKELAADCFAGYYLGSLDCEGRVNQYDIVATLTTACVIADGTGDPIRDLDTHGTCQQRAGAVARGIAAYLAGNAVLASCAVL